MHSLSSPAVPMRTFLDDAPIACAGQSLREALRAVGAAAADRLIVSATADGLAIPAAHLERPPDHAPYAAELRFLSAPGGTVITEAAAAATAALDRIEASIRQAVHDACIGRTAETMHTLSGILTEWQDVRDAASLITRACGGSTPGGGTLDFDPPARALVAALVEVHRLLAAGDWSALADALEDDLTEVARQWRGRMGDIAAAA